MGIDPGFSIDLAAATSVGDALDRIATGIAELYQAFGGRTGVGAVGQDPAAVLGTRDPTAEPAPPGAGTDVPDGWNTFCTEWGAFIDESVGVATAMSYAMRDTVISYQGTDDQVANAFRSSHGNLDQFTRASGLAGAPTGTNGFQATAPNRASTSTAEKNRFTWLTTRNAPPPGQAGSTGP